MDKIGVSDDPKEMKMEELPDKEFKMAIFKEVQ